MGTKTEQLATDRLHKVRVRGWVKIVVESETGLRMRDELVIVYPRGREPLDRYSDGNGEVEMDVPFGRVEVEFPGLFRARHDRVEEGRTAELRDRKAGLREGTAYVAPSPRVRTAIPAITQPQLDEEDVEDEQSLTWMEPNDEEDDGDAEDESDFFPELAPERDTLLVETPQFFVETNRTHVFRVPGQLAVRLSSDFFAEGQPTVALHDEDGVQLLEDTVRSTRLTFDVGIGTYRLVVDGVQHELESMPSADLVHFVPRTAS